MSYTIYALFDPRTTEPFYVGQTSRNLRYRYLEHIKGQSFCGAWERNRELRRSGLRPLIMELLRFTDAVTASQAEYQTIADFEALGFHLTNSKRTLGRQ